MYKDTVTRTFSIGAICSGAKASDDFFTARRHSSAGMRALLWATSGSKSFGSCQGSDFQTSRENVFSNVLTPGSIPQFTIPSLSVQRSLKQEEEESEEGSATERGSTLSVSAACPALSSDTPSSAPSFQSDRRAERSVSDPLMHRGSPLQRMGSKPCTEAQHCLDPASRAALSLPHLTKVTTPYGFVTLSQSPQMASEEALLCRAGQRRLTRDEDVARCPGTSPDTRTVDAKDDSSQKPGAKKRLPKDSSDSQSKGRSVKAGIKAAFSSGADSSVSPAAEGRHPDVPRKHLFYKAIKKHLTSRH